MAEQNRPGPLPPSLLCRPQERGQLQSVLKIRPQHPSDWARDPARGTSEVRPHGSKARVGAGEGGAEFRSPPLPAKEEGGPPYIIGAICSAPVLLVTCPSPPPCSGSP